MERKEIKKKIARKIGKAPLHGRKVYSAGKRQSVRNVKSHFESKDPYVKEVDSIDISKSILSQIALVRKGLSSNLLLDLINSTEEYFSKSDWAEYLGISERSIYRCQNEKRKFSIQESEKILLIYRVIRRGMEVFKDKDKFNSWFNTKLFAFNEETPRSYLNTYSGIIYVLDELIRLEHGVLA